MTTTDDDERRDIGDPSNATAPAPADPEAPLLASQSGGRLPVLRISGAVDLNSHGHWERILRRGTVRDGELHLDLTDLVFIDMRGVSLLVDVARGLPGGARIVVHRSPACMRRMMEVLWPEGLDAITIKGDAR
jgi:anti-anti-sigma regulatory factor